MLQMQPAQSGAHPGGSQHASEQGTESTRPEPLLDPAESVDTRRMASLYSLERRNLVRTDCAQEVVWIQSNDPEALFLPEAVRSFSVSQLSRSRCYL